MRESKQKGTTKVVPPLCFKPKPEARSPKAKARYSIIPARASSDFTAILCSTLRLCRVLSSTPLSSFSLPDSSQLLARIAETSGGRVFRAIRAACDFKSALDFSNSDTRSCKCRAPSPRADISYDGCSSTAATIRSTFVLSASCCASSRPSTRSNDSAAFASRSAVVINCCTISSFMLLLLQVDLYRKHFVRYEVLGTRYWVLGTRY